MVLTGCKKHQEHEDVLQSILNKGELVVGVKSDTKPFGFYNESVELVGFDVDLAKLIAKSILGDENKVKFIPVTSANRISMLNSKKVDMIIATMTVTPQRSEVVEFSIPYYITGQALLVPSDSKISSMSQLNGKKVIIVFGTTSERNLRFIAPEADIIGFKTYIKGYGALKTKHADAMTSDETILMGFAMSDKSVKLLPKLYSREPYAIAMRKGESTVALKSRIDFILEQLIRSGEINKLKYKWLKY